MEPTGLTVNLTRELPLLPLKNSTLFPGLLMPLAVGRIGSVAAVEAALATEEQEKGVGFPFLAVLDGSAKVVTAQRTEPLEEGRAHNPTRVKDFLSRWVAPRKNAGSK